MARSAFSSASMRSAAASMGEDAADVSRGTMKSARDKIGAMFDDVRSRSTIHNTDELLNNADMLTQAQELELREHTEIGHRLLAGKTSQYLQMGADIALHHHEHYDGTGYPRGLKGRDIPLPARIVAVAEAFELLTARFWPQNLKLRALWDKAIRSTLDKAAGEQKNIDAQRILEAMRQMK